MKRLLFVLLCVTAANTAHADSAWPLTQAVSLQADTPLNRVQIMGAHNARNDSDATWANQRWPLE